MSEIIDFQARHRAKVESKREQKRFLDGTMEITHEEFTVIEQVFSLVTSLEAEASKAGRVREAADYKAIGDVLWDIIDKGRRTWPPKGYA